MVTKDTPLNELFDAACLYADTIVQSGENFRVKDLFRGVEWSRIPKGFRTKLGFLFFAYVTGEAKDQYEPNGRHFKISRFTGRSEHGQRLGTLFWQS